MISEKEDWNQAYYGHTANSRDILTGRYTNPQSSTLSAALPR